MLHSKKLSKLLLVGVFGITSIGIANAGDFEQNLVNSLAYKVVLVNADTKKSEIQNELSLDTISYADIQNIRKAADLIDASGFDVSKLNTIVRTGGTKALKEALSLKASKKISRKTFTSDKIGEVWVVEFGKGSDASIIVASTEKFMESIPKEDRPSNDSPLSDKVGSYMKSFSGSSNRPGQIFIFGEELVAPGTGGDPRAASDEDETDEEYEERTEGFGGGNFPEPDPLPDPDCLPSAGASSSSSVEGGGTPCGPTTGGPGGGDGEPTDDPEGPDSGGTDQRSLVAANPRGEFGSTSCDETCRKFLEGLGLGPAPAGDPSPKEPSDDGGEVVAIAFKRDPFDPVTNWGPDGEPAKASWSYLSPVVITVLNATKGGIVNPTQTADD